VASIDGKRADGSAIRAIPLQLTFEGRAPVDTYLFAVEIEDGGTLYYDFAGERFDSVEDWHNNTRLPPARYTYTGVSVSDDNDRSDSQFVVRETRTLEGLDIGIKFYGKVEFQVDLTHEIYRQVLLGGGSSTSAEVYERGKEDSPRVIYQHRIPTNEGSDDGPTA